MNIPVHFHMLRFQLLRHGVKDSGETQVECTMLKMDLLSWPNLLTIALHELLKARRAWMKYGVRLILVAA
jgi:hypothetical protein